LTSRIGNNAYDGDSMMQVKDFFNNRPIIFLIVAIVIGAAWYFSPDQKSPRVEVSHEIYSACLDLESRHRLVRAIVDVHNVGPVQFKLMKNNFYVNQVVPFEDGDGKSLIADGATESKSGPFGWRELLDIDLKELLKTNSPDSVNTVLKPNNSRRQYVDFLIPPSSTVIELKSDVKVDRVLNFIEKPRRRIGDTGANGQVKTIYDVRESKCTQKTPDVEETGLDSETPDA
jgi:hypothetical protein